MDNEEEVSTPAVDVTKGEMLRDALIFQIKLVIDGIRDFILIPVSLIATVMSLLKPGAKAGSEFYDVVAFGRDTEHKINLFGAADRIEVPADKFDSPDLDTLVDQVESYMRREYEGGRFTAARERLEKFMATLDGKRGRGDGGGHE